MGEGKGEGEEGGGGGGTWRGSVVSCVMILGKRRMGGVRGWRMAARRRLNSKRSKMGADDLQLVFTA